MHTPGNIPFITSTTKKIYALIYTEHFVTLIHAQAINTYKHIRLQNTLHVYSGLAALICSPILLKHYCIIKYIVSIKLKTQINNN